MSKSLAGQVSRNLIFRYRLKCLPAAVDGPQALSETHRVPMFGGFEGQGDYAELRMGWTDQGIAIDARVTGKKKSLWCRATQLLESDGLHVWLDTRNTHNVHRATKFCHWFLLLPSGGGSQQTAPLATTLKINRAREDSPALNRQPLGIEGGASEDGYQLRGWIPAACLAGWNPVDQRLLGFSVAFIDRELGWQTLGCGPEMPILEDPSLWQTLELSMG